jgi:hypothetical protein
MYDSAGKQCTDAQSDLRDIFARIKDSNQESGVLYYEVMNAPYLQPLINALTHVGLTAVPVQDTRTLILVHNDMGSTLFPVLRIEWKPELVRNWWPKQKFEGVPKHSTSMLTKFRVGAVFAFFTCIFSSLLCALVLDRHSVASHDLAIGAIGSLLLLCLLGLLENEPANQSN